MPMSQLPQFQDGLMASQGDLNALSTGVDTLCRITTGKPAASGVSSKPMGHWYIGANVPLANAQFVPISWTVEGYDTDNVWSPSTPTVLKMVTPGKYVFSSQAYFAGNANGARSIRFLLNGTNPSTNTVAAIQLPLTSTAADVQLQGETYPIPLNINDTITVSMFQNSNGQLNLLGSTNPRALGGGTWVAMEWVAPL